MAASTLSLPRVVSPGDRLVAHRAAIWLSLGAAPTFASMAMLTGIFGGGAHDMLCSAAAPASLLNGMLPMYLLMSAFHVAPWLTFFARRRSGASGGQPR